MPKAWQRLLVWRKRSARAEFRLVCLTRMSWTRLERQTRGIEFKLGTKNRQACEMATNAYRLASCGNYIGLLYSLGWRSQKSAYRP